MSASRKFRSLCINMTLPLGKKWHSCRVDCRAGLATLAREHCRRMWWRKKNRCCCWCCCCMYYLNKITLKRWIMWAWSQISNLWTLRWFYLFYLDVSNQIFAELRWMMVQYVESDLDDLNMQLPDCFCFFFLPENMHRWVFSEEFHEVWMFVLLRIAV